MDKFDFSGKLALVTGASSGIGRETAVLLSKMGAQVVLIARRGEELKKTLSRMEGTGHRYYACDLSDFDGTVTLLNRIVTETGCKIDCVAHCAGTVSPTPLRALSKTVIDRTLFTNLYSFAAILKCAASKKIFNNGGSIVAVSSGVAAYGQTGNSVYGASKGAIDAMVKSAAKELMPKKIRVNSVRPSSVRTEMLMNLPLPKFDDSSLNAMPDTFMEPQGVAGVIVSLLCDSSCYISGVCIDVDEGDHGKF